jgi:hypothetical protein
LVVEEAKIEYILIQLDQNTRNAKIEEKQNLQIHKEKSYPTNRKSGNT